MMFEMYQIDVEERNTKTLSPEARAFLENIPLSSLGDQIKALMDTLQMSEWSDGYSSGWSDGFAAGREAVLEAIQTGVLVKIA